MTIARSFVEARREGRALDAYPGAVPATLDQGYAIQAEAIGLHGGRVAGWKVGRVPASLIALHGTDRLAGPIFADTIADGAASPAMPVFDGGFAAAEAEYVLRIARLPEGGAAITNAVAMACIDEVRVGIEVASSPYAGINADGPAVTVSDFGNNHGLVLGDAVAEREALLGWRVKLSIDGEVAGDAVAGAMLDGPFGAARFLFELAAAGRITVRPGQWISSGAVTGVHQVRVGQAIEAVFDGHHRVACTIVAAKAQP